MDEQLRELNWSEAFGKLDYSLVYKLASQFCNHAACPIPLAIIRATEVDARLLEM